MISETSKTSVKAFLLGDHLETKERPVLYTMAGIPASGKSTFVEQHQAEGTFPQGAFTLNPDLVMGALDEYHLMHKEAGAEKAFAVYEMPSRALAYDFFAEAVKRKVDIIKDMGNARIENIDKIKELKAQGYLIKVFFIYAPVDVALQRAALRERHVPESVILERAASLKHLVHDLIAVADHFAAFDSSTQSDVFTPLSTETLLQVISDSY